MNEIGNIGYINNIRILATFAVVMIHVFSQINSDFSSYLSNSEYYICIVLVNFWQWCIPLFVMITGVLFLDPKKDVSLEKILKKYFLRIILAILVFGIPYCFMKILFEANMSFNIGQIGSAILNTLQGKSWAHMWYLYMIAGLYLCIPFIKLYVTTASNSIQYYTLVILFIFTSIIPAAESIAPIKIGIYIPVTSVYIFYLLLGYYVHYNKVSIKNGILFMLTLLYILYSIIMPLNKDYYSLSNAGHLVLTEYNSPLVALAAFSIFCIFRQNNKSFKLINNVTPMCFGVYLVHAFFINLLYKYIEFTPEKHTFLFVIISTILITITMSLVFTYFARKITIIKEFLL